MSSASAFAIPQAASSVGRRWIAVHVVAQLICLATAGVAYGLATLIGANDPTAGLVLKKIAFGLGLATQLIYAVSAATLRGNVLRQVLPTFPTRLWVVVVAGYLMLLGLLPGFFGPGVTMPVPRSAPHLSGMFLIFAFGMIVILGAIMGLITGTIEAMVLRRVAEGAAHWVIWSMVAWSAAMAVLLTCGIVLMFIPGLSPTALVALSVAMKLAIGAIVGALTLPALKQLRSR